MITLFENFTNKIDIKDFMKEKDGKFEIPNFKFEYFGEWVLKNPRYFTQVKYNSLMRFYLYMKLLRYNGDSPIIKNYIVGLKGKDLKKMEIINKIPNNNHVRNMINEIFGFNYPDYEYSDFEGLQKFISASDEIFNDKNLLEYINLVIEASSKAARSEKIVKGVISMLYNKYFEITYAKLSEDLRGMDLWKINKNTGVRQSIQVKNITGNVKFNITGDTIYIDNTSLDLHKYECWKGKLPYDYLAFYLEKEERICIIKSTAIFAIDMYKEKRSIKIKLKDWAMKPDFHNFVFKLIDVPKKFIGKDISKIFYTPDMEKEIQGIDKDIAEVEPEGEDKINPRSKGVFY